MSMDYGQASIVVYCVECQSPLDDVCFDVDLWSGEFKVQGKCPQCNELVKHFYKLKQLKESDVFKK